MTCASLPMYDWPELRAANDAWWTGLARAFRAEGIDAPHGLTRTKHPADLWGRDDLLLSQTCGYPLTHAWSGRLQLVATPTYDAEGCDGADYCSFILVHADSDHEAPADLGGARAAYNSRDSQSGYSALRAVFAPLARDGRFFGTLVETGAHIHSMEAVERGRADVCAIDAIVWALARRHRPAVADRLRPIARSPAAPGLPYVTAVGRAVAPLRAGIRRALADPSLAEARHALMIAGAVPLDAADYVRILEIEGTAVAAGYPELG